ncbi:protein involved in gliding motility GldI [Flavobacteriaceae bacterium MAR_2010_188]|nr:protein involved in gliding motility GldI [Flavobacteriaceae bacterium MAR_2010_188]
MRNILTIFAISLSIFACKSPDAREPISKKSGSFIKESAERNIELNNKEKALIEALIAKDSGKEYIASETGFWYTYNVKVENDSTNIKFGDILNFDYSISDLNGNTIYSEKDLKNRNYAMDQEELFTGLREGLKIMKPGETVTFIFPSQKAYGYYGDKKRIGTNIPIITKVKLNSINKNETD